MRYGAYFTISPVVKILIIINVSIFFLFHLFGQPYGFLYYFGVVPQLVIKRLMLWQLLTYMFIHRDLWHILFNMLMLWFFGPEIEISWGRRDFLIYYFFTGLGASIFSVLFNISSYTPVIGASGAILGLLLAYAMMYPDAEVLFFFLFPMKMRHLIWLLIGINLVGLLSWSGGNIAYLAHLGGLAFGYIYLKSEWIRLHLYYLRPSFLREQWRKKKEEQTKAYLKELDREVDLVLDKIARYGIESLTPRERKILEIKSRQSRLNSRADRE